MNKRKVLSPALAAVPARAMTVDEVCAAYRLGRNTVLNAIAAGSLPSLKIGTSRRILVDDADRWILKYRESVGEPSAN